MHGPGMREALSLISSDCDSRSMPPSWSIALWVDLRDWGCPDAIEDNRRFAVRCFVSLSSVQIPSCYATTFEVRWEKEGSSSKEGYKSNEALVKNGPSLQILLTITQWHYGGRRLSNTTTQYNFQIFEFYFLVLKFTLCINMMSRNNHNAPSNEPGLNVLMTPRRTILSEQSSEQVK